LVANVRGDLPRSGAAARRLRVAALSVLLLLGGCMASMVRDDAQTQLRTGNYEAALKTYDDGQKRYPENVMLREAALNAQGEVVDRLLLSASAQHATGQDDAAQVTLQRLLRLRPAETRARAMLLDIERDKRQAGVLNDAQELFKKGQVERAQLAVESALKDAPDNATLLALQRQIELGVRQEQESGSTRLADTRAISLEFRDANLRMVLEALTRTSGTNFIVDKDVRPDLKATIFLRQTKLEDAIELLCTTNQLGKKVLDPQTILIYPNTPEKAREYQDLVIRAFYLSSSNVKQTAALLKSLLKIRDPFVDEKLNLLMIRESPETVRLAERLVALHDVSDGEVMLEVEVLEVTQSRLTDLGIDWPSNLTLTPLVPDGSAPATILSQLSGLNRNRLGINTPSITANFQRTVGDSNVLANPKIRVRNHEKAKILIGDKLPIVTSTATATGFVSESIQYIDVGLKFEVEPSIYPDGQVGINMALEVSSLADTIKTSSGTTAYRIGTRNTNTVLELHDGETQILAGLINRHEATSANRVPGLGDVPLIGRLFGSQTDSGDRTEIVLSITPHIVRSVRRPDINQTEFWSGTEANVRSRPLTLASSNRKANGASGPGTSATPNSGVYAPPSSSAAPLGAPSLSGGLATSNAAPTPVQLTLQQPANVKSGESFDVEVKVKSGTPIRGLPMQISYNKAMLLLTDVREGPFFKQGDAKLSLSKTIDAGEGRATIGVIRNSADGAQGEGAALILTFKAVSAGSAQISIASSNPIGLGAETPTSAMTAPVMVGIQ
jgi:general secretion pathway protein D